MGRKPNALILQHFERGAKLNDSSNRYAHTCKACGEKFPKGRIDSLTNHLVKKCPGITLQQRQKALLELNGFSGDGPKNAHGESKTNGPSVELPIGTRNWTALETLAEASRQIATNEKPDPNQPLSGIDPERPDQLELREQYTLENPPLSYEQHVQRGKKTQKGSRSLSHGSPLNNFSNLPHSRPESPNLAMAASSMAAAQAAARFIPDMVDPQLDPQLLAADSARQMIPEDPIRHSTEPRADQEIDPNGGMSHFFPQQGPWPIHDGLYIADQSMDNNSHHGTSPAPSSYPRLAMSGPMTTEFSTEFGNGTKPNKPKVRGKFQDSRRKEVQAVRKMGACIRCRMLKKTCGAGNPCDQCKTIDSARLWKTPCSRVRLSKELDMFDKSIHTVLSIIEVNSQKSQAKFEHPSEYSIDTTHYPGTGIFANFKAIRGQKNRAEGDIDPGLSADFSTVIVRVLDTDDDMVARLEEYTKMMLPFFVENEPSTFMQVTLSTAMDLSTKQTHWPGFLTRALELWACVHILVDGSAWSFTERLDFNTQPGHGPLIDPALDSKSYELFSLQINAAAEKKAGTLVKTILNETERDLLNKTSNGSFTHFLAGIILLHCIEKATWLFQCWEQEPHNSRWPIETPAGTFTRQGDKVIDILTMLFYIRKILPPTFQKEDGTIASDFERSGMLGAGGAGDAEDSFSPGNPREYYERIHLDYRYVHDRQTNYQFDPSLSSSFDLRFVSKLLLGNPK